VCYERNRSQVERKRCFTKDEGRPLEVGLQEQASNRLKLRRSRALVVSVDGKGGAGLRQVRIEKLPARAVAGWASHPLESAAFSRRTPTTEVQFVGIATKWTVNLPPCSERCPEA
jgi:hypothetical protein